MDIWAYTVHTVSSERQRGGERECAGTKRKRLVNVRGTSGLALAIALDCLPNMNLWLRTGLGAVGCCLAFDFFGDCLQRKLLKLGFLALCVIMDGYWTVTVMMMITFENITWEEQLK